MNQAIVDTMSPDLATPEPFRVFWQPGCSSCVKVKEFLTGLGVPFESVNVMADPQGMKDLATLGLRSVPVVTQGKRYTHAQSLQDVATFVGQSPDLTPQLQAPQLVERWLQVLRTTQRYVAVLPPARLNEYIVPGRERTLRDVAYHIYQAPDAFLQTVVDGLEDWRLVANVDPPKSVVSVDDIAQYAQRQVDAIEAWWAGVPDPSCAWKVKMFYGHHSVHSFLERSVWHSAQHARQLAAVLGEWGIAIDRPLTSADYVGLPMPAGLWE